MTHGQVVKYSTCVVRMSWYVNRSQKCYNWRPSRSQIKMEIKSGDTIFQFLSKKLMMRKWAWFKGTKQLQFVIPCPVSRSTKKLKCESFTRWKQITCWTLGHSKDVQSPPTVSTHSPTNMSSALLGVILSWLLVTPLPFNTNNRRAVARPRNVRIFSCQFNRRLWKPIEVSFDFT